jgi:probable HAF family extracellular repeat protein
MIVGEFYLPYLRSAGGSVATFTLPEPSNQYGEAHALNDAGTAAGYSGSFAGDSGFIRLADGTITPVGFASPEGLRFNYAFDVNAAGQVVGEGYNPAGQYRAFRTTNGVAVDLGTLDGFATSQAFGINDAGTVVGRVEPPEGSGGLPHAFIYRNGVMYDLNDFIPVNSGWTLAEAREINGNGAVVGWGVSPSGATHAFLLVPNPASVLARRVFYNNSAADGNNPAANAADDAAIDAAKSPLRPGQAVSAANVTAYSKGINGVMIDLADLPPGAAQVLNAADFTIRSTSPASPNAWSAGPAPSSVTVRPGAGANGSDRVTLTWPDGAVVNRWLEVTLKANVAELNLPAADVFAVGNLAGDANGSRRVDVTDLGILATNFNRSPRTPSQGDFSGDRVVNVTDLGTLATNFNKSLPPPPALGPGAAASLRWRTTGASAPSRLAFAPSARQQGEDTSEQLH